MTKVAIYARYSSDNQREASIEDQIRLCREHAAHEGWTVLECYTDQAISGASLIRPGIQELIAAAHAGRFEVVLAEAMDRLSRDQEDIAGLYKRMSFAGVKIVTLSEGEVSNLHVGLKGTMNALFLKDLADKTRRGLRGRVEKGKSGGGNSYGYDVVKKFDAEGEPIRGERTVNEAEAEIVRRIFRAFADGISPRALARALNAEGVPGPRGKAWTGSTIRGHSKRGTGIINNELYIGRLVWNRLRYIKDPDTGKRVSRLNPPEKWIIKDVPELRIIDRALWERVKARQEAIRDRFENNREPETSSNNGLTRARRRVHLLSGLLTCGICGGRYTVVSQDRYGCFNRTNRGTCINRHTIKRQVVETRLLTGLQDKLIDPDVVRGMIREMQAEANRSERERHLSHDRDTKLLAEVKRKIAGIVSAVEDGKFRPALLDRLDDLERQKGELEERLKDIPQALPALHPGIADIYRDRVADLIAALDRPDAAQAAGEAIRALIDKVILTPDPEGGEMQIALYGELDAVLYFMTEGRSAKSRPSDLEGRLHCIRGCGGRI